MEKSDENRSATRRHVLAILTVGAAMEFNSGWLPGRWTKPVVEAVVLPAHAQTSPNDEPDEEPDEEPEEELICNAGSLTVDNEVQDGQAQGHVAVIYDGDSSCSLIQVITDNADGGSSGDPDEMLLIDADNDGGQVDNFDLRGPDFGANWGQGPDEDDLGEGDYSFDIERVAPPNAGTLFRVEFSVSFSGFEMTVSNVQIRAL